MDSFIVASIAVAVIALTSAGGVVTLLAVAVRADRPMSGEGEG